MDFFISDNLSLNLFNKNDQILQNLQQELNLEIDTLRKEQTLLYNESLEQLRNQQRINNDLENRIIELQNQIKNLEQKNQELLNKINQNQSSENPFNQIPESEINE